MIANTIVIEDNNPDRLFTFFLLFVIVYILYSITEIILLKKKKKRLEKVRELITKRHEIIEEVNERERILNNNMQRKGGVRSV